MTTTAQPFLHIPAADLLQALASHTEEDLKVFREAWEDLPVDAYLKDGADYRRRRYGSFRGVDRLAPDTQGAFHQSVEVNALHGGVDRHFPPLAEEFASSGVLRTLVSALADRLPGAFDRETGGVGIHQIRIVATRDAQGLPAPEGVHEDGHHFVAQVFMGRSGVQGGASQIYDREHRPLLRTTLTEPFETIVIDDRRVFHGVDAIEPADGHRFGIRDMLLVDFFPRDDR
ncbi:2OG-Fe dioxygenase family protein [Streptomyces sp. NPDC007971]|uniref:2OG-Fe dioxygenase family protein n=1 Tax=Streptomyces sp. NPDC007971 TaxID=3364799 RepID=UPI0036E17BCA